MNLFDIKQLPTDCELVEVLASGSNVRVERIISTGQSSDWYDQHEAEFVALLQGNATLEYANGEVAQLQAGDCIYLPPHKIHRVQSTSTEPPCVWLCFFW